jgi:hypothetical protein
MDNSSARPDIGMLQHRRRRRSRRRRRGRRRRRRRRRIRRRRRRRRGGRGEEEEDIFIVIYPHSRMFNNFVQKVLTKRLKVIRSFSSQEYLRYRMSSRTQGQTESLGVNILAL